MWYLFSELFVWLLLIFIFGLLMGWFSRSGKED